MQYIQLFHLRGATILWRDPKNSRSSKSNETNFKRIVELNIVDEIIKEPIGGAHRDREMMLKIFVAHYKVTRKI